MEQNKICNKIHIQNLSVHYVIDALEYKESENTLLGDMVAVFDFKIYNNKLPKKYILCMGNDYAKNPPTVEAKYGTQTDYTDIQVETLPYDPYVRTRVREFRWSFDKEHISGSEILNLSIRIKYKRAFDFSLKIPNIIIFFPKAYGEKIDLVNYKLDLLNFPMNSEFKSACYSIANVDHKYDIQQVLGNVQIERSENKFRYETAFESIVNKKNCAYYFEIERFVNNNTNLLDAKVLNKKNNGN